jgi:2-succinyl-6-hydroxy-2,4-cyclohexadiene-1-carboxylate synthase
MNELQLPTYVDTGTDLFPVIFLHGFLGCKEDWDEIAAPLKQYHRTIQVDLPGHGGSVGFSGDEYSIASAARQVIDLMNSLGIPRSHLVGYSMGARIALYLAVTYPDRIERIMIESGSAGLATETERASRRQSDSALAEKMRELPLSEFLNGWYNQPLFHTIRYDTARFAVLLERRLRNDSGELAKALVGMGTGSQPYLAQRLRELPHQILFAAGSEDDKYLGLSLDLCDECQDGTVWVCPEAGHAIHFEKPTPYIDTLRTFLLEGI